jgi:hypothetical protein
MSKKRVRPGRAGAYNTALIDAAEIKRKSIIVDGFFMKDFPRVF